MLEAGSKGGCQKHKARSKRVIFAMNVIFGIYFMLKIEQWRKKEELWSINILPMDFHIN